MTTKLIIENGASSNGDINVRVKSGAHVEPTMLTPGKKLEKWISTGTEVMIDETYPTKTPAPAHLIAGEEADALIEREVAVQDRMWGNANERADSNKSQLMFAGIAQLDLTALLLMGEPEKRATAMALLEAYPKDWEGLRSYGSIVANLAVAAAFIRSEMKRRIMLGEDMTRTSRGEPYTKAIPYISSAEAIAELQK